MPVLPTDYSGLTTADGSYDGQAMAHNGGVSDTTTSSSYQAAMMFLRIWPFLGAPLILLGVLVWRVLTRPRNGQTDPVRHTTLGG